jgi:septal ring factor EnvC (AmiA/AmiB activator)
LFALGQNARVVCSREYRGSITRNAHKGHDLADLKRYLGEDLAHYPTPQSTITGQSIMKKLFVLFLLLLIGSTSAMAARISERVDRAQERIEQGIRSGSLTRDEARSLRHELNRVREDEDRARRDGHLDQRERGRLDRELDRLERRISEFKHNDAGRGDDRGHRGDRDHRRY